MLFLECAHFMKDLLLLSLLSWYSIFLSFCCLIFLNSYIWIRSLVFFKKNMLFIISWKLWSSIPLQVLTAVSNTNSPPGSVFTGLLLTLLSSISMCLVWVFSEHLCISIMIFISWPTFNFDWNQEHMGMVLESETSHSINLNSASLSWTPLIKLFLLVYIPYA